MSYEIEILSQAWEDLKQLQDYYCLRFNPSTARKVRNRILATIERLQDFPDSGSRLPDEWLTEQGYRMVICGRHIAVYKKFEETKTIYIYHIADTRSEYTKLFVVKND